MRKKNVRQGMGKETGHETRRRHGAKCQPHPLLRDTDGDGKAEFRSVFLQNLHSAYAIALVRDTLYVANALLKR